MRTNIRLSIILPLATTAIVVFFSSSYAARGNILAYGDDSCIVYFNGNLVGSNNGGVHNAINQDVDLAVGDNVIAIFTYNKIFGMGMIARLESSFGSLGTDTTTWKTSGVYSPAWKGINFDDSNWGPAGDQGDPTTNKGVFTCATNMSPTCELYPFVDVNAKWIWSSNTLYMRKKFTSKGGPGFVHISSQGPVTVFVNGAKVGQDPKCTYIFVGENEGAKGTEPYTSDTYHATFDQGDNVVSVIATDDNGSGLGWGRWNGMSFCSYTEINGSVELKTDTTWRYSDKTDPDWNTLAFDDSKWALAGKIGGWAQYKDPVKLFGNSVGAGSQWIWSQVVYFRKIFHFDGTNITFPDVTSAGPEHNSFVKSTAVRTEYYTILGRKLTLHNAAFKANAVTLKRTILSNGKSAIEKVLNDR